MTASRTTPTLWVLVIITGPSRKPDSSTQVVPVISPLPFSEYQPAKTGSPKHVLAARQNGGDSGAYRAFADLQLAGAGDQSGVADFDALHVGDGVERAGRAVEGNAQVAGARLRLCGGRRARAIIIRLSPEVQANG